MPDKARKTAEKPEKKTSRTEFARRRDGRITVLGMFFLLCLAGLLVRIGYIKYIKGEEYERRAVSQAVTGRSVEERAINPNRGYILDRNKQPLAVSQRVYTVFLDVTVLDSLTPNTSEPDKDAKTVTLTTLSEVFDIPLNTLEALFKKNPDGTLAYPTNYHIIGKQVPASVAIPLREQLRCVYLEDDTLRKYTDPFFAPQTIGFMRGDTAWGLENQYNEQLTGERGRVFMTYGAGSSPVTEDNPARDGYSLITTLDAGIQRIAQAAVENAALKISCLNTAILVMNPYTGEIIAMAQWPSFSLAEPDNPLYFNDVRITNIWEALSNEERLNRMYQVWGNFHTTRTFEPGSIFKPVVVAAAIEENIIDPATATFFCGGKKLIYDWDAPCWNIYGHGGQNLVEVLANSCNLGMIDIVQQLGRDLFYKYRNDFGFGEKTDIDLPGESGYASTLLQSYSQLGPVELAAAGIGQGFNNTAIQALSAFAAVINGGNLMKPYIVSQIIDENGNIVKENTPTIVRKVISQSTSDFMRYALQAVVTPEGTGKGAVIEGYTIGGKTGSGQQGLDRDQMTLSFIAYTPVESPEYIIMAIIDHPADIDQTSSVSVAPMIKEALMEIFKYKNMLPAGETPVAAPVVPDRSVLSDYSGMQMVEASHHLNNLGVDYQVVGTGITVDHHIPAAGQPAPEGIPVYLYMDAATRDDNLMTVIPDIEGLLMEQAEDYLRDAHLTPVSFIERPQDAPDASALGEPITYNPQTSDSDGGDGGDDEPEETYTVVRQFPAPGTRVQQGTEIKLKVKIN